MKITQEHVGKKVRCVTWDEVRYVEVLCVGNEYFFGKLNVGSWNASHVCSEGAYLLDNSWELYEEPKKKKILSPAVFKSVRIYCITPECYESEEEARVTLKECFISWPAMQLIDGKEVPIQIVVEE